MSDLFEQKNISPMLLYETLPFDSDDCIFELKLDGIRCIAYLDKTNVTLQNKRHKDVTDIYPELGKMYKCVSARTILDGELVLLSGGKPDFYALTKRSLMSDEFKIKLAAKSNPVQFVAYDILYYNGEDLTELPLIKRKKILAESVREGNNLGVSRYVEKTGIAFFNLAEQQELEGIVAKKKDGLYHIGKRTRDWLKIKVMQDEDLFVLGYSTDTAQTGGVKDLILGYAGENGEMICRGKVYLGVSESDRKTVSDFAENNTVRRPWSSNYKDAVWLKPELVGKVRYMQKTDGGGMRQPVFKGLVYDKVFTT